MSCGYSRADAHRLRMRFKLLRMSQERGALLELTSHGNESKSSIFRDFLALLNHHNWRNPEHRWEAQFGDDVRAAKAYWSPEALAARPPTYSEALRCARYVHRCEHVGNESPWPKALHGGVIEWILLGLQMPSTTDSGTHKTDVAA